MEVHRGLYQAKLPAARSGQDDEPGSGPTHITGARRRDAGEGPAALRRVRAVSDHHDDVHV